MSPQQELHHLLRMKGSTRQIPGASFIWSCFVRNRASILCPLKCDFRPLGIAWQPCVRLPRNIATRSRFYSRRSANTYPSLESDHKNDPYHGKTGQHALTSNKIFFSKSPVFAVHRGIVRAFAGRAQNPISTSSNPSAAPARRKRHIACGEFFHFTATPTARSFCCSSPPDPPLHGRFIFSHRNIDPQLLKLSR